MKSMYVINNSRKLFTDEFTEWFLEAGFIQYQCHISIYYNYSPDRKNIFVYLMLIIVSIGIHINLLKNGL